MKTTVKCGACGRYNTADRLFCMQCGAKLDLSKIRLGHAGLSGAIRHGIKRLLRVAVLFLLVAVLGLLLWPATPQGAVGDEEDARAAFDSLSVLYDAIQRDRSVRRTITEEGANAYLARLVGEAETAPDQRGLTFDLQTINLTFTADSIIVHIATAWKFMRLTYTLQGRPVIHDDGPLSLDLEHVALGRLPLPSFVKEQFAKRLVPLYEVMEREQVVLNGLSRLMIGEHRVRLIVGP